MITYPVNISRNHYSGSDQNKRRKAAEENRIATELEICVNELLKKQKEPIKSYNYIEVANASEYDMDTVRKFCFSIDGGSNGFTAYRSGLTYDEAWAEHKKKSS